MGRSESSFPNEKAIVAVTYEAGENFLVCVQKKETCSLTILSLKFFTFDTWFFIYYFTENTVILNYKHLSFIYA